ncbi:CBS domain-containing protein [Candidatus Woesearchaeota archaeon]|nr:CBS domain-containing protein [Candidatus Woesearchaeota archaeon]
MYRVKTGFTVADAMTTEPVTVSPKATLREAAKIMAKEHVGALLVKDKEQITGILTEQDIVRKGVATLGNTAQKKVNQIMETNLVRTTPEEDVFEALRIMRDYNIRHLPVMHQGKFVGLVTLKDILKIEPDLYEIMVEKIQLREIERKPVG